MIRERGGLVGKGAGPLFREVFPPICHPTYPAMLAEGTPRNVYLWILLSAPGSEGLNVSPEAKHPFQEVEFDSWVGTPTLVQCSILSCIYISGVNTVTHPALGQMPGPLPH